MGEFLFTVRWLISFQFGESLDAVVASETWDCFASRNVNEERKSRPSSRLWSEAKISYVAPIRKSVFKKFERRQVIHDEVSWTRENKNI